MTNGNQRGSATQRRRRREWLLETYRADVDAVRIRHVFNGHENVWFAKSAYDQVEMLAMLDEDAHIDLVGVEPACRCFRCGKLLTLATLTVDRIVPGYLGGRYRCDNVRPACERCNNHLSKIQKKLAAERRAKRRPGVAA